MARPKHEKRPHDHAAAAAGHAPETLRGVVQGYNYSPKGEIEGVILDVRGAGRQVNFPPGLGGPAAQAAGIGETVEAVVEPEPGAHEPPRAEPTVSRLVLLRTPGDRHCSPRARATLEP